MIYISNRCTSWAYNFNPRLLLNFLLSNGSVGNKVNIKNWNTSLTKSNCVKSVISKALQKCYIVEKDYAFINKEVDRYNK